jgi:hypothetical protein
LNYKIKKKGRRRSPRRGRGNRKYLTNRIKGSDPPERVREPR